jgi:methyltransferase (TIGR00027 family)
MARTDDDTWDINESVDPLISDPYAQLFLEAAGDGIWKIYVDGELPAELVEVVPRFKERMEAMKSYMGSRTKFFDEFFLDAAGAGIRQAVILAAGLDARAWRLAWPDGSVVYEIDQPKVLAFKTQTLESHDVAPIANHVSVGIDLRQDWPKALVEAGFDPTVPTAWSAEGLLPYLTADAQDLLFDRIQSLSAHGSRVAVEAFTNDFFSAESFARREEQMEQYRGAAVELGGKDITESGNLLYEEERTEVPDWLRAHDWNVTAISAEDLLAANNRLIPASLDDAVPDSVFVEGRLP